MVLRSSVPCTTARLSRARVSASRSKPATRDHSPMYIAGAYWACKHAIRSSALGIVTPARSNSSCRARTARLSSGCVMIGVSQPGTHGTLPASVSVERVADDHDEVMEIDGREITITHADKVFFSERGETKLDLVNHYVNVAEPLMRTMGGRPVLLQRFPEGAGGPSFFQKRVPKNAPDWLKTTMVS